MKVVGIIPARFDSSRLPGKPLKIISGKPMIVRVYERAKKADCWDELVVATDKQEIKSSIEQVGGIALLTSQDLVSGTDRVAEACKLLGLDNSDLVVNIQGDEPLLPFNSVRSLVEVFKSSQETSMGTLAFKTSNEEEFLNPNVVKVVMDKNGNALYFSRASIPFRRDISSGKVYFLKHLGFYIYTVEFLRLFRNLPPGHLEMIEKLEQLRVLENGYKIKIVLSDEDSYGVDTIEDLSRVEKIIDETM